MQEFGRAMMEGVTSGSGMNIFDNVNPCYVRCLPAQFAPAVAGIVCRV